MTLTRRLRMLAAIALAHTALTIVLGIYVFADGMARFEAPGPSPLPVRIADGVVTVLSVPLLPAVTSLPLSLQPRGFPGEHLTFLANGLVWALVITASSGGTIAGWPAAAHRGAPDREWPALRRAHSHDKGGSDEPRPVDILEAQITALSDTQRV